MRMLIGMFFKLKEGSRTRGHKAALVKEQCRLARLASVGWLFLAGSDK